MKNIKDSYEKSVDDQVLSFVHKVVEGKNAKAITVGFVDTQMAMIIKEITGLDVDGNRIILTSDAVKHIIKRHGKNGVADHTMADYKDIARICYVLCNYDEILYNGDKSQSLLTKEGEHSPHIVISKRINGFYYIVEAVSDGKRKQNTIVSAYKANSN